MGASEQAERLLKTLPVPQCINLLRLFHAVDCFPRGGLYTGYYAVAAAIRYERYWIQVFKKRKAIYLPPLDVAFAWFVHRQDPASYHRSLLDKACPVVHPTIAQAFLFGPKHADRSAWAISTASDHPAWPPPAPGSPHDPTKQLKTSPPAFALQVAASMSRFSHLLRSWLRPHFLDEAFLQQAKLRYGRFLALHAEHPGVTLVPSADVALLWHTHLGLSGDYADTCEQLFSAAVERWRPDYLDLSPDELAAAYSVTAQLYQAKYGEPYDTADTAWLDPAVPYPLAALGSPLSFTLRIFDWNPEWQQQREALDKASAQAGLPFPAEFQPVARSGAHALFAAWLAARRAEKAFLDLTCYMCWRTSNEKVQAKTLRHAMASLVSVAYFLDLPESDTHPYLLSIRLRSGLWKPHKSCKAAETTAKQDEPVPPPSPAVCVGFSPSDPARYLSGRESDRLHGLSQLLATPHQHPDPESNPLWTLLDDQCAAQEAWPAFMKAWDTASRQGVGRMQRAFLTRRNSGDGNRVYGSTDYYAAPQLYIVGYGYYGGEGGGGGFGGVGGGFDGGFSGCEGGCGGIGAVTDMS